MHCSYGGNFQDSTILYFLLRHHLNVTCWARGEKGRSLQTDTHMTEQAICQCAFDIFCSVTTVLSVQRSQRLYERLQNQSDCVVLEMFSPPLPFWISDRPTGVTNRWTSNKPNHMFSSLNGRLGINPRLEGVRVDYGITAQVHFSTENSSSRSYVSSSSVRGVSRYIQLHSKPPSSLNFNINNKNIRGGTTAFHLLFKRGASLRVVKLNLQDFGGLAG